jgi:hypothetical protein
MGCAPEGGLGVQCGDPRGVMGVEVRQLEENKNVRRLYGRGTAPFVRRGVRSVAER